MGKQKVFLRFPGFAGNLFKREGEAEWTNIPCRLFIPAGNAASGVCTDFD